jgi:hypothetical protein
MIPTLTRPSTSARLLPRTFDGLAVFLVVQAHVLAAIAIARSVTAYRSVAWCVVLLAISLAVPLVCLVIARRSGQLPTSAYVAAVVVLALVDVALVKLMRLPNPGAPAVWTWGTIGVTALAFAVYRPVRDVLILGAANTLIAIAFLAVPLARGDTTVVQGLVVLSGCVIPTLVAARYLASYIHALEVRDTAVRARLAIETRMAAEAAVYKDGERRLRLLRAEILPLFAGVADGSLAPDDPAVAERATRLAAALRRQLVEARTGQWLLDVPGPASTRSPDGSSNDEWPGVVLLDPTGVAGFLGDADRAALSALLGILRHHSGWERMSVSLVPGDTTDGRSKPADGRIAVVTVVGIGPAVLPCRSDPQVLAAARQMDGDMRADLEEALVIRTRVRLEVADRILVAAPL